MKLVIGRYQLARTLNLWAKSFRDDYAHYQTKRDEWSAEYKKCKASGMNTQEAVMTVGFLPNNPTPNGLVLAERCEFIASHLGEGDEVEIELSELDALAGSDGVRAWNAHNSISQGGDRFNERSTT